MFVISPPPPPPRKKETEFGVWQFPLFLFLFVKLFFNEKKIVNDNMGGKKNLKKK